MKRVASVILAVLLLISMLPAVHADPTILQDGDFTYYVVNGEAFVTGTTEGFTGDVVVIPETLGGYPVTSVGSHAFYGQQDHNKTAVIPACVKYLGYYAFCTYGTVYLLGHGEMQAESGALQSVRAVYKYEDLSCDGSLRDDFWNVYYLDDFPCVPRTLTAVTEGAFTYAVYQGEAILLQAAGDGSVTVPDRLGGAPVVWVGPECFQTNGAVYTLPDSVISIGTRAFRPSNGAKLTKLPTSLKRISLSALADADLLDDTLPESLTKICIYGCRNFKASRVVIPGSVKSLAYGAFMDSTIYRIDIEEGVESIGRLCFWNVPNTTITIPRSVTQIADIFNLAYVNALKICGYSDSAAYEYATKNGIPFYDLETGKLYGRPYETEQGGVRYLVTPGRFTAVIGLTESCPDELVIPEQVDDTPVTMIKEWGVMSKTLQSVYLPDTVTELEWHAFENCPLLEHVRMSEGLTHMNSTPFYDCPRLRILYLPPTLTQIDEDDPGDSPVDGDRGNSPMLFGVAAGSYAETYARRHRLCAASLPEDKHCIMTENGFYEIRNGEAVLLGLCASTNRSDSYYLVPDSIGEYPVTTVAANAVFAGVSKELVLGDNVSSVEPGALLNSGISSLYTTEALTSLPVPLFDTPGRIFGYAGSCAEQYAAGTQDVFFDVESTPFEDVKKSDWFFDAVHFCFWTQLMNGVSDSEFQPSATTSRAMLVTILYRYAGSDTRFGSTSKYFMDVPNDKWYTAAVNWAAAYGIVQGTGQYIFSPKDPVTREQIATILYRFASLAGCDVSGAASMESFPDSGKVSRWAKDAMMWTVDTGIIRGTDKGLLNPGGYATRAEIATMMMRFNDWLIEETAD